MTTRFHGFGMAVLASFGCTPFGCDTFVKGEDSPLPLAANRPSQSGTGNGTSSLVDPQEEIYDNCLDECINEGHFDDYTAAQGLAVSTADIHLSGWSYFCVSFDATPTNYEGLWWFDQNLWFGFPTLSETDVRVAAQTAFSSINHTPNAHLELDSVYGGLPPNWDSENAVVFMDGVAPMDGALAVTAVETANDDHLKSTTFIFKEKFVPGGRPDTIPYAPFGGATYYTFHDVVLHETLHGLGLDHTTSSTSTVMQARLGIGEQYEMGPIEEAAVAFLYPDWTEPLPQAGHSNGSPCNPPPLHIP